MTALNTRGRGRPQRTSAERVAQRARLLDGAMSAIRRLGPDASIDQMAADAGVSKPVLYDEFGDKVGIAEAIAIEIAKAAEQTFIERLAADGTLDIGAGARAAVEALVDLVTEEPELYQFLVRTIRASDRGLFDISLVRALDSRVHSITGLLVPRGDPELLSVLGHGTFGFVFAAVESWQRTQTPSREKLVDAIVTIVVHGFQAVGSLA
ncbi:MAG TPA: TetR/AcrR family transcriptional regulator [Acidimicrobiales bacterium]|nr:TetR/AcrR family transcriptional regulator [Acidimicrobiales bacterium]